MLGGRLFLIEAGRLFQINILENLLMTEPVSPNFNHKSPPDANPHLNPSPAGGQVHPDPRFLGDHMARDRGLERRERDERLRNE